MQRNALQTQTRPNDSMVSSPAPYANMKPPFPFYMLPFYMLNALMRS